VALSDDTVVYRESHSLPRLLSVSVMVSCQSLIEGLPTGAFDQSLPLSTSISISNEADHGPEASDDG
jgi:hypothetical protein